ncbi:MAG: MFS transporter [Eubacteriales bacterium]
MENINKFNKRERNWIMYDFANSAYATIMIAAIFPIYFVSVCKEAGIVGDVWWGIGTSITTFTLAILAPFLGAIADFKGMKKKLFTGFLIVGLLFTIFNAFVDNWQLMLLGYVLSNIGWAGSLLFYDSFLTDVTTKEKMDRVSAWGYGMGYIGGSTIPFVMSILLIMFGEKIGVDSVQAVKLSLIITAAWWLVFSIPFLKNIKQTHYIELPPSGLLVFAFRNIWDTIKNIVANKGILLFMVAYFFYIDGVNTVIHMATSYGATLGLDGTGMILALLVTQLVAFPCAILFSLLSSKFGTINMIISAIIIYFFICIMGFYMGFGMEQGFLDNKQALNLFWILAVMVGTCQGGIQALSRSYFGKLIPPERSNEYFGFFDIFGKFAAILGPLLYALIAAATGRSSFAMGSIIFLFLAGGIILFISRKHLAR